MPEFLVRVGMPDGRVVEQRHRASSAEALRRELEGRGVYVFSVKATRRFRLRLRWGWREKIKPLEFLLFNQQLATLLAAGMPVLQSLELLQRSQANPFFREVLARVLEDVRSGIALSEAFAAQGALFPPLYCATLFAGERSGELVGVLRRYIRYQHLLEGVRRRVTSALTYPAVLLTLAFGLVVVLITYVIPRFAGLYQDFDAQLPLLTLAILGFSGLVKKNATVLVVGLVAAVLVGRRYLQSEPGRLAWDRARLRLPFVGEIFHLFGLSQFVRALATLLAGGTPLVPALEVAVGTVTNRAIAGPLTRVIPMVREGQPLWSSLESTGLFPELSVAMVQVGEATGALEEMLTGVGQFYDESIEVKLTRVVTLIEPIVLVLMGGVIVTLLLSVYLPMFTLLQRAQ
ncbi:MAG: type II secretion system F family protein [Thermoanaerobaculum sp.]|nr:type II secretion system F family protein [Thermoanaerobaculum sp.]MDW7968434.1 type II secretion system F family protein [Thermoanaerobaculum sp.]